MSLQVFSGEKLEDLHITSVADLTSVVPGFSVAQSYQGVPQYSIRGIGFHGPNMTSSPTVTLYQDQIAYPYPYTQSGPLFDIERVEVLKGPQGTLYGRNTTAGVISLTSGQPTDTFQGSAAVDLGNYQTRNFEGFLSGPLTPWLKGRIAMRTEDSDEGWQVSDTRPSDRLGKVSKYGVRGILAAEPTSDLKINLEVSGWHNGSDTRAGQAFALTPELVHVPGGQFSQQQIFQDQSILPYIQAHPITSNTQADWEAYADRAADQPFGGLGLPGALKENTAFYTGGLNVNYDIDQNLHLISISSYQHLHRESLQDVSGTPYELLVQQPTGTIKSLSQELRLEGEAGPVRWGAGGYYGQDKMEEGIRSDIGDNANALAIQNNALLAALFTLPVSLPPDVSQRYQAALANTIPGLFNDSTGKGLFRDLYDEGDYFVRTRSLLGNMEWKMSDQLTLTTGARYTQDHLGFSGCTRDYNNNSAPGFNSSVVLLQLALNDAAPLFPVQQGGCLTTVVSTVAKPDPVTGILLFPTVREIVNTNLDEHNWSWHSALTYRPTEQWTLYISATQGAKSAVNPLNTASNAIQDQPVKQEILRAYETGVRTDFGKWKFSVAAFYYDYKDKQEYGFYNDPVFSVLAQLINIPHSRAYGSEGGFSFEPVRGLTLFGNGLYLQTQILNQFIATSEAGPPENLQGHQFADSPKWSASGGLSYQTGITDALGLRGTANYQWQSYSYGNFEDTPEYNIGSYGTLDGSVGIFGTRNSKWEFSLWGRNLTDRYYVTSIVSNSNTLVKFPGLPRTFGGTLRYSF